MKEYKKPIIEEEDIEVEDICTASTSDETSEGKSLGAVTYWFGGQ